MKKYIATDIFPLIDFREIAVCLQGCDILASEELLSRPTPTYVLTLWEQIAELFLGFNRKISRRAMVSAMQSAKDGCLFYWTKNGAVSVSNSGPNSNFENNWIDMSKTQADGCDILCLTRAAHRFMVDCGIDDFAISDLIKPEPARLRRILSAVVNFARFREEHIGECEEMMIRSEEMILQIEDLTREVLELKQNIYLANNRMKDEKTTRKELESHNAAVEVELLKLKKMQERLAEEHEDYKSNKLRLTTALDDQSFIVVELKREIENLRQYVLCAPATMAKVNSDMANNLESNKITLSKLEDSSRKYLKSTESFNQIEQDLNACVNVMEECVGELSKEDEMEIKIRNATEVYENLKLKIHDLERKMSQFKRQIIHSQERATRTKQLSEEKRKLAQERMSELRTEYANISAERTVRQHEMDKKKSYIESTEKKMEQLRDSLDTEWRQTQTVASELVSHIESYITEMEKRITVGM